MLSLSLCSVWGEGSLEQRKVCEQEIICMYMYTGIMIGGCGQFTVGVVKNSCIINILFTSFFLFLAFVPIQTPENRVSRLSTSTVTPNIHQNIEAIVLTPSQNRSRSCFYDTFLHQEENNMYDYIPGELSEKPNQDTDECLMDARVDVNQEEDFSNASKMKAAIRGELKDQDNIEDDYEAISVVYDNTD